jgi:hypothetical protein
VVSTAKARQRRSGEGICGRRGVPSPCGLRAQVRAHLQRWGWHGGTPWRCGGLHREGASAPIWRDVCGGHGVPSPSGLRAQVRAHLQRWDWHGGGIGMAGTPGDAVVSTAKRAARPGRLVGRRCLPSPCGLRARGRAHLQRWGTHGRGRSLCAPCTLSRGHFRETGADAQQLRAKRIGQPRILKSCRQVAGSPLLSFEGRVWQAALVAGKRVGGQDLSGKWISAESYCSADRTSGECDQ